MQCWELATQIALLIEWEYRLLVGKRVCLMDISKKKLGME
jgi:hypothetical protein